MLKENLSLIQNGCALHWLHPRTKRPVGEDWSTAPVLTLDRLKATKPARDANIGIRLGKYSKCGDHYWHFLDADIRVKAFAGESYAALDDILPEWRSFPKQISGSGGDSRHIAVLLPEAFNTKMLAHSEGSFVDAKGKTHWNWEIELLGTGKQAALSPSIHPDSGLPYRWEQEIDWDAVAIGEGPTVPLERARGWQLRSSKIVGESDEDYDLRVAAAAKPKNFSDEEVLSILKDLPKPEYLERYKPWLDVGMALHHQYEGSAQGLEIWVIYSSKATSFDRREMEKKWEGFECSDDPLTMASLKQVADKANKDKPANSDLDDDLDDIPSVTLTAEEDDEDGIYTETAPPVSKIRRILPSECATSDLRGYVVKGMIAPRDVVCIFGAPGAGKSLISPLIGYAVALGNQVFGMRTKPGKAYYIAAEDAHGMRGRIAALRRRHGDTEQFILIDGVGDLFSKNSSDYETVRDMIKEDLPDIVFIDTLAMAFPGLEENDAQSMGRIVAIARKFTKWGAAVVLIHHDTKAAGGTPRGHSVLNGALDTAMWLQAKDELGIIRGKLTKNRNGPCDVDIAFRIEVEAMGVDQDGDVVTYALAAELAQGDLPKPLKLTPAESAALKVLRDMLPNGVKSIDEKVWRDRCISGREVSNSEIDENRGRTFRKAYSGLTRRNLVTFHDGRIFISESLLIRNIASSIYDDDLDEEDDLVG